MQQLRGAADVGERELENSSPGSRVPAATTVRSWSS
jgi:hypothetical protein